MRTLLSLLLLMLIVSAGCGRNRSATEIKLTDTSLTFDPATCKIMKGRLELVLGSITVDILKRERRVCTFEFTHEIEGGYKVYRVDVATNSGPVMIQAKPDGAEVSTSFDLKKATVVRSGNIFFD